MVAPVRRSLCSRTPRSARRRRLLLLQLIALASLSSAAPASAQSVTTQAQSLFDQGRDLAKAGNFPEACAAFESSQQLDPAVTTLLNLADCRAKNEQLASAWGDFVEANRMARAAGNDKLARVAAKHAEKLRPRLSQLTVAVATNRKLPGLQLLRGTEPLNPVTWNHALPIDAGTYTFTAKAPGRKSWTKTVTVKAEADVQTVEIPLLPVLVERPRDTGLAASPTRPITGAARMRPAPWASTSDRDTTSSRPVLGDDRPASAAALSRPSDATPPRASRDSEKSAPAGTDVAAERGSGSLPLAIGAGSIAIGAAVAAVVFKRSGDTFYDRAKNATSQVARESALDSANTRRLLAIGLASTAVVGTGTALYLYFRHRGEVRSSAVALAPVTSLHHLGVAIIASW
jgi:hypothetical protein